MACYPWIDPYRKKAPLDLTAFPEVQRWHEAIAQRPATQRAYERGRSLERTGEMTEKERKILFGQRART
jgi:GST-like protein